MNISKQPAAANYYASDAYRIAINEACISAAQGDGWDARFVQALKERGLQVKQISDEYAMTERPIMAPMPFNDGYPYPSHIVRIPN